MLSLLKDQKNRKKTALKLYKQAMERARQPAFYEKMGVPDTLDGRYELVLLHVFLIINRVKGDKSGDKLAQKLFDVMYKDMDQTLREIGIGDLSVPKHMRRMMNGFNGRVTHYEKSLPDHDALKDAARRNIYGTLDHIEENMLDNIVKYIQAEAQSLDNIQRDAFDAGEAIFKTPL